MNDLKNSILLLLVYILAIFGVAQIDFVEQNLLNFESIFFILVALAVLSALIIVPLTYISVYHFLLIWSAVYVIIRVVFWQASAEHSLQLLILEFVLMDISAFLAYDIGRHLRLVSRLLDELTATTFPNRTLNLRSAADRVGVELTRSRRYGRPLSLLVVRMEHLHGQLPIGKNDVLQRDILDRFAAARIGQVINDLARETDLILRDTNSRFIVICPETEYLNTTTLAGRISKTVIETTGATVQWGASSFPDEALTFDDLVEKAMERLNANMAQNATINLTDGTSGKA